MQKKVVPTYDMCHNSFIFYCHQETEVITRLHLESGSHGHSQPSHGLSLKPVFE